MEENINGGAEKGGCRGRRKRMLQEEYKYKERLKRQNMRKLAISELGFLMVYELILQAFLRPSK